MQTGKEGKTKCICAQEELYNSWGFVRTTVVAEDLWLTNRYVWNLFRKKHYLVLFMFSFIYFCHRTNFLLLGVITIFTLLKLILWFDIKFMNANCIQTLKLIQKNACQIPWEVNKNIVILIGFFSTILFHRIARWDDALCHTDGKGKHYPWPEVHTVGTMFSLQISSYTFQSIKLFKLTFEVSLHIFVHKLFKLLQLSATMKGRTVNNIFTVSISPPSNPLGFCYFPSMWMTKI